MCRVLTVSRCGFYAWLKRPPSKRAQEDAQLRITIRAAHERTRKTYGPKRLQKELAEKGVVAGRDRISRLRREDGIYCIQRRKFKATTNSNHNLPVAANLLDQVFKPTAPNQVWVSDITYVPTDEGWLYLAGIKDVFTCEIVGYAMGSRMTKELVSQALWKAVKWYRPPTGLILHSDQGSQYCSHEYRKLVKQFGLRASMSRRGNCYDNSPMESFWGSLKNELVYHRRYETRAMAEASIREYIEIF
jgi:transposase InsO family protein